MTDQDNHWRWATPDGSVLGAARPVPEGVAGMGGGLGGVGGGVGAASGLGATGVGAVGLGPTRLERWRDAVADRLPATLRGRWSLDRTTAIVLVVSVLLAALVLGG